MFVAKQFIGGSGAVHDFVCPMQKTDVAGRVCGGVPIDLVFGHLYLPRYTSIPYYIWSIHAGRFALLTTTVQHRGLVLTIVFCPLYASYVTWESNIIEKYQVCIQ